eukprot:14174-Heterococcus_DN1.PRE.3
MSNAARFSGLELCQYLRAEQCPWDARACEEAAYSGYVDTLRWLHEQGCPWDVDKVRLAAAGQGHLPVIVYMQGMQPTASAAQLTEMLSAAGAHRKLPTAEWLRQQAAEWPALLKHGSMPWRGEVLQWARDEGCTSPAPVQTNSITGLW